MTQRLPLMVFTDLDGTLLDHQSYDWTAARPALDALKARGAAVVLASSKSASEMAMLRSELELQQWPAIVENGAGLLPANRQTVSGDEQYRRLRDTLDTLPTQLRQCFTGFGDMSVAQVADITGLDPASAMLARRRGFSEPGLWQGSESHRSEFLAQLGERGVHAQQGGRFLTLSFGANKADQVRLLAQEYKPELVMALGDAPNDVDMLEAADIAFIVANPHALPLPELSGESEGRVLRTREPGPVGWNSAVLSVLENRLNR